MATYRGKRVSPSWATILSAAAHAGVRFTLNSGQRTLTEQQALYALYRSGRGNLAAIPNRNAPHIRTGHEHHALDIEPDGGHLSLARWLRAQGISGAFTIPIEPWHWDPISERALKAAAARLSDPFRNYPADERRWIREYDRTRLKHRRRALQRVMLRRRKMIWRAAQRTGWDTANRRRRYESLLARTR